MYNRAAVGEHTRVRGALLAVVAAMLLAAWPARAAAERFEFALIGDLPYNAIELALFRDMLASLDGMDLVFVVHDGDLKSAGSPCTDEFLESRRALLDRSAHPLVYLFGDNEWTDCHRKSAGGFDPLDRLARLRALFAQGNASLGKRRLTLERQGAATPENVRWSHGGVRFIGLHVVGSNNNRGRTKEMDREYDSRTAANLAWLRGSFALAREEGAAGVVVLFQGDPRFELAPGSPRRLGFDDTIVALEAEVVAFDRPTALVHGDTHRFRIDRPLRDSRSGRTIERFTRVVTFGSPHVRWVRGTVDQADPALFRFEAGPERPRPEAGAAGSPAGRPSARPRRRPKRGRRSAGSMRR